VGREGPIIQIGSAVGSSLGQVTMLAEWQRNTLIAAGAAAGIAATFNAPLGGLLFAIEIILPETSGRTLIPVALATGAASFVARALFGNTPSFDIPALANNALDVNSPELLLVYVVFGVVMGLAAFVFTRSIYLFEGLFERLPGNAYIRHVIGMGLVGVMMYAFRRWPANTISRAWATARSRTFSKTP